eukprot:5001661-Ditylum_brightwellii.AAC.1
MLNKQKELKNVLQDYMLVWRSWNWFCANSWRNNEWTAAVEGVTDPVEMSTKKKNSIDNDWCRENK